jgi:hypothetical protein
MAFGSELTNASREANATSEKGDKKDMTVEVVRDNCEMKINLTTVFEPVKVDDTVFCTHV